VRGLRGSVSLESSSESGAPPAPAFCAPVSPRAADDEDEAADSGEEGVIATFVGGEDEKLERIDQTQRLALVDLEWDRVRAVDILVARRAAASLFA